MWLQVFGLPCRTRLAMLCTVILLGACGGGGGADHVSSSSDSTTGLALASVQTSAINTEGQLFLTAVPVDAQVVTGYCFKATDTTTPSASDACFQASPRSDVLVRKQTSQTYFVWSKNAKGDVSLPLRVVLGADVLAPTLLSVTAVVQNGGDVKLQATATDDDGVAGYCFKTTEARPDSGDVCFTASPTQTVALTQPATLYYAWAKDYAGNVSSKGQTYAGCSPAAYYWSGRSVLPRVCLSTSLGEVVFELEDQKAPQTSANFLRYVNEGYYSDTIFHRVISTFMVQGGGYTSPNVRKSNNSYPSIALEDTNTTGFSHLRGTVAMARTSDPNSATTEFFVNVVNNESLNYSSASNPGYAVFGRVIYGLDTSIENIRTVPVQSNGSETSLPTNPPVIHWAYQMR